jgi:hypothetical protein
MAAEEGAKEEEEEEEEEVDFFGLPLLFFSPCFDHETTMDLCGLPIAMMPTHSPSFATC